MKNLLSMAAIATVSLGLVAGCAYAKGGDQSLVSPSQPHAIISTAEPPQPSLFRAQIIWLDGQYLSNQKRNSYWVAPGKHEIGFRAIMTSNRGPNMLVTPATTQATDLPTLTIDVKQGYTYFFAAKVPESGIPSQWKPVLIKEIKTSD